jgi:NADH-quinone oxidoreductase subunit L
MLPDFEAHPGYYFVAATLLPLASFVLILLANALWAVFRPYRDHPAGAALYNLFGGDRGGRVPAYVALGAIAGAFVLSLTGFVKYNVDRADHERKTKAAVTAEKEKITGLKEQLEEAEKKGVHLGVRRAAAQKKGDTKGLAELREEAKKNDEAKEKLRADLKEREKEVVRLEGGWGPYWAGMWAGRTEWLRVRPAGMNDPERGSVLQVGFAIDNLAALMFVMVTFVAMLIHLYSIGYMSEELSDTVVDHQVDVKGHWDHLGLHAEHEPGQEPAEHEAAHPGHHGRHLERRGRFGTFFLYLSLFCFSMLNLVLADNLFQVFLSWELVGICSFLLIGFYFERKSASNAANKAFITNRVGDAGFILGLLILWSYVGTFNFEDIFRRVRCPERDSDGALALKHQIVRAEPEPTSSERGRKMRVTRPNETPGSEVALFPLGGHWHGLGERPKEEHGHDEEETEHEPTWTFTAASNPRPRDYGSMPYWLLVAAGLGIFLGCVGKSAQFPLQVWLPDAMEGPTPVSALIHAATMVAAGVYLVGRCYPLFAPEALLVIAYTGGITLFVAATIAVVMTDIKKVLAYSTVSQLGYMMLALGIGGWVAGLFHLLTHAFFKALLFLGSGSVIFGCHHEQEMTRMGGLYGKMKVTALTMLAGVLAIAGTPLFSGWYSKDAIVAQALGYVIVHPEHLLLFLLPLGTAGLTTFYMFRMWFLTFTGKPRDEHVYEHAHESPWTMTLPLVVLAVCSIAVAWGWPLWDAKESQLEHNLAQAVPRSVLADFGQVLEHGEAGADAGHEGEAPAVARAEHRREAHYAHDYHDLAGLLALGMVALGIVFASLLYYNHALDPAEAKEQFPKLHAFLVHKWYFDELYSAVVVRPALVVGRWCRSFDGGVIDGVLHALARGTVQLARWDGRFDNGFVDWLVNLVGNVTYSVGAWLRTVQTGSLRNYVLFLVLAAVGIFVALSYFVALAAAG